MKYLGYFLSAVAGGLVSGLAVLGAMTLPEMIGNSGTSANMLPVSQAHGNRLQENNQKFFLSQGPDFSTVYLWHVDATIDTVSRISSAEIQYLGYCKNHWVKTKTVGYGEDGTIGKWNFRVERSDPEIVGDVFDLIIEDEDK